jgi:putative protease
MKAELLAPAGSWEAFEAALSAGADAVYVGGSRFGARAYADNLDQEQMCRAIDRAHLLDRKLYMTVNTLLKERELEELYGYLLPFCREGLDGVIVQDFGVLERLRSWFPGLPLHASTQMAVTGAEGAALLQEYGVSRVVPARELSLKEIRTIYDRTGMEIECFVHGALCYSYSGQCLMSSLIGGRSGNRGRCAQPCRLPWEVYAEGKRLNGAGTAYPLNTRDMCAIELLPDILDAGVFSLKIEGRMKRPEYTAGVVGIYRKYLDLLEEDPGRYSVKKEDRDFLAGLFNRDGFNRSYFLVRNGREMMALKNVKAVTSRQEEADRLYREVRERWLEKKPRSAAEGRLELAAGRPARLEISCAGAKAVVEMPGVERAENHPVTRERVLAQMNKTGGSPFYFRTLDVEMEDGLFIPMQLLSSLRRAGLEKLEKNILGGFRRDFPDTPETQACAGTAGKPKAPGEAKLWASVENDRQAEALKPLEGIDGIYLPAENFLQRNDPEGRGLRRLEEQIRELLSCGKQVRIALPYVTRPSDLAGYVRLQETAERAGAGGWLVRNLESAAWFRSRGKAGACILDAGVYTFQNAARRFWNRLGFLGDTVPLELNAGEIARRDNGGSEMIVYGRSPMMISAQCIRKNLDRCTHSFDRLVLKDRKGAQFPVACCCNSCYNVIYNSLPTGLLSEAASLQKAGCRSFRLSFTTESAKETAGIARRFADAFTGGEKPSGEIAGSTRGHYRRGVE